MVAAGDGSVEGDRVCVTMVSKETVSCEHEASLAGVETPMYLGPMDFLIWEGVPIQVVLVYEKREERGEELIPIERLRRALAKLLDNYPHLTGRFERESDCTTYITRLGTGIHLYSAECSASLDSFSQPCSESGRGRRIVVTDLPNGGNALLGDFEEALFTVQRTKFACGSVSLGIRLMHRVCDAEGFFQLVKDLAELYRGLRSSETNSEVQLAHKPHLLSFKRELREMTPEERRVASEFKPKNMFLWPDFPPPPTKEGATPLPKLPVFGRVLRFGSSELESLKTLATPNELGGGWISTFEALAAHLLQRVYLARFKYYQQIGADLDRLHGDLLFPVGWRGPLRLNLPPRYFPNAVITHNFTASCEVLSWAPVSSVAKSLHDMLQHLDKQQVIDSLDWVAAQPNKSHIIPCWRTPCLMLSQWNKFDMYVGVDFDVDKRGDPIHPVLVAPPFTPGSEMGYILATEAQADDKTSLAPIDVQLALTEPIWEILDQDPEFRRLPSL